MARNSRGTLDGLVSKVLTEARRSGTTVLLLEKPLVVGVSGGADSLALLHILIALRGESAKTTLHVAHLDHGLRGEAGAADAKFVRHTAEEWGLPCTNWRFDVPALAQVEKLSPEEAARSARYAFLSGLARKMHATVTVAHNADDQAETVLMNILRGTGISGLAAMRPVQKLLVPFYLSVREALDLRWSPDGFNVFRPLLSVWRREIEAYCAEHSLEPRVDATNDDVTYSRNHIRHVILPLLDRHYKAREHLYMLSQIAAPEDRLVERITSRKWHEVARVEDNPRKVRVDLAAFARLPLALRHRITRRAIKTLSTHTRGIGFRHIESASQVLAGEPESPRVLQLPDTIVAERHEDWSVLRFGRVEKPEPPVSHEQRSMWPLVTPELEATIVVGASLTLDDSWVLTSEVNSAGGPILADGLTAQFDLGALTPNLPLTVRTRRAGDVIQPLGMAGHKRLQDLFVDAKIPRAVRAHLALVTGEATGEVLWVPGPGGRRSAVAPITPDTRNVLTLRFVRETQDKTEEG